MLEDISDTLTTPSKVMLHVFSSRSITVQLKLILVGELTEAFRGEFSVIDGGVSIKITLVSVTVPSSPVRFPSPPFLSFLPVVGYFQVTVNVAGFLKHILFFPFTISIFYV